MTTEIIDLTTPLGIFTALATGHYFEDWDLCKDAIEAACEVVPIDVLAEAVTLNYQGAMTWYEAMVRSGLDSAEKGSKPRQLFLKLTSYVMDNASPEVKQMMDEYFMKNYPELETSGYTAEGNPCCSLSSFADALEADEEEVVHRLDEMGIAPTEKVHKVQ